MQNILLNMGDIYLICEERICVKNLCKHNLAWLFELDSRSLMVHSGLNVREKENCCSLYTPYRVNGALLASIDLLLPLANKPMTHPLY